MTEIWESLFAARRVMWGEEPTRSALLARDFFVTRGAKDLLIPGVGYGRNAKPFVDSGMSVTGIEVSASAIALARSATASRTCSTRRGARSSTPTAFANCGRAAR